MFKNALVSVADKTGLENFLGPLVKKGLRVVSSGGTARYLTEHGIEVINVSDQTQFPEVMGGRVKTLHPFIHMPLLYRGDDVGDQNILKNYNLQPFDLVVVNLYPFAAGLAQGKDRSEMIELIDIGGPTLLRAAAKNYDHICVVCDPQDYQRIGQSNQVSSAERRQLAAKVFSHVAGYDHQISNYLSASEEQTAHILKGELQTELRYGENPQQSGYWYKLQGDGLHQAAVVQGKPLSYNNLLDLDAACRTLNMFAEPTVVAVKHNSPCGVASDRQILKALKKSLAADPVSVFGGVIASNRPLDGECAGELSQLFIEVVIAPSYTTEALAIFAQKKNMRILTWPALAAPHPMAQLEFRSIWGGYLMQTTDPVGDYEPTWTTIGKPPTELEKQELLFAWKVCAALKSNAIAITGSQQSLGLGMGQVNRVDAVKQAISRAQQFHGKSKNWVLASDAFFPFPDSITAAAAAGVEWVIQPGGSIKDDEVIAEANRRGINMVLTGQRHFRH